MQHAVIATRERLTHQVYWGGEFGAGLKRHGWRVTFADYVSFQNLPACDMLIMWGIRKQGLIAEQKQRGGEICILERGYILDRFNWSSVSFGGGLNGRGIYHGPLHDSSRWERHFAHLMQPWRSNSDGYALILGQVPGDTAVANVDLPGFYERAKTAFEGLAIPTKFREHPRFHKEHRPLELELEGAQCVVTWNSNSGVDAVLAGVPAVAVDPGSMAWDVSGHECALPPTPDRTAWAHAIAWKQWTADEMTSGYCWDHIQGEMSYG